MLHVLVMESAKAGAVRGIERSAALPDARDVVNLDPPAAGIADTPSQEDTEARLGRQRHDPARAKRDSSRR
jgi:hypothetical protein